jgi:hydroxymethylbilane synthase
VHVKDAVGSDKPAINWGKEVPFGDGQVDALILAQSGLERAGLFDTAEMSSLPPEAMLPAAGQGALALQCRSDDQATMDVVAALHDSPTQQCVETERTLVELLQGDCHSPIAALAEVTGDDPHQMRLRALVAGADAQGRTTVLRAQATGNIPAQLAQAVYKQLDEQGSQTLLRQE